MKLHAKKSLGQHFLTSKHALEQIIDAAAIKPDEEILEIGPGTGILTEVLLKAGAKVTAIEKDSRTIEPLKEKFAEQIKSGQLKLIEGDILDSNLKSYILNLKSFALVANIPYYITGAILEKFLEHEPRPDRMVILVQKEVADRIIARPEGNEEKGKESILSVSVKAFGIPKMIAKVPRGAFNPPPSVDSAILSIEKISADKFREKNVDIRKFFEVVRAGFAHKRKFLIRNLEELGDSREPAVLREIWSKLGLNEKIRAEDLSIDQWFDVVSYL